ncbi:hypothetical protein Tco_1002604 [Tanacetum coccineum]|uniref:Uncharacterized protein n=1 Tax=Tanacetum coccineum TaxID=301880 RepID=A0ABQ5F6Q5_9ASTR
MSSASSAVTYTSVYTNSEPGRVFWGADEEISDGGIPRVIVLGYDGLPMQPVAPPSPDYVPGPEDPQTPPVPQDEDEREPMFVQAHDPDYVPEPIYPEYIPLEDEHEFPAEEQPLPPVDSPTAESPRYVTESDPEEDPEEYEDDETEDGPVDYPMDGGDDGDDDDGDSSGDDTDDEDEDDEDEEEEEERLASADSAVVASISLPPDAEVERLLAMPTPSPSPPISLSPPSVGECLARCTAPPALSSPPPVPSPLLPSSGCPTQIQTLRIASTQALIDAVTAALPSPPLPPLPPSLYIPPPIDRRDDLLESELPPRKRLCLSTLGSRYEIRESSTARPTRGRGVDYGFVSTVDAEARRQGISEVGYGVRDTWVDPAEAVPEVAPMTVGEVNTRVTQLAELHERDTQDLMTLQETVWMVEEEAYASREAWAHSIGLSQATHQELQTHRDHVYAHETHIQAHQTQLQLQGTLIQTQHQMTKTLRVMRDMRREMSDMQAELLAHREQQRRARQPGPDARIPDHQDASGDADSHVQTPHDSLLSGGHTSDRAEGVLNLHELSVLCTNLSNRVLALESIKDAQAAEISALKSRIKKLEKKCKPSISHHRAWLKSVKRLSMKKRFGKQESVSKQGRKKSKPESTLDDSTVFDDQDADHGMEYIETKEVGDKGKAKPEVSTARPDIDAARLEDSVVKPKTPPTTTSIFDDEDITMASKHFNLRLRQKKLNPKDKGKGVLKESPIKKVKRSDLDAAQIAKDAKIARLVHEKELAEMEREREEQLRAYLKIVPDEEEEIDYEVLGMSAPCYSNEALAIPEQTATDKEISNPFMPEEHIIVAGAENRPPMLEKLMYDSWASRIRLLVKGKKHGRMMLDSIDNGPLVYPTVEENGQTRPKKYLCHTPLYP